MPMRIDPTTPAVPPMLETVDETVGINAPRPGRSPEPPVQPFKLRVPHPQETAILQRHRTIEATLEAVVQDNRWIHHVRFTDGTEGWVTLRTVRASGEPFWEVLDVPPVSP